ncbi:MAG: outer membrane protein assembly factor BamD [Zetaproteobacteria bacterium]|nr:MAG: outer membrane protein assembly factor BamD [Zetaproteobacteria bacterium]
MIRHVCLLALVLALASCASDMDHRGTAAEDYAYAKHLLDEGAYERANMYLEHFDEHHPYSHYSIQAELLRIFAAYKNKEYILSETLSQRFIDRHPRHPDVDYAKYMLGMSYYHEIHKVERDATQTQQAIKAFSRLIREHPRSSYAKDAAARLQSLYDKLAAHELAIGKYYFDRERYVAAANRFEYLVRHYASTSSIEEALYYLAASYARLGLKAQARDFVTLLRHNFPHGEWTHQSDKLL